MKKRIRLIFTPFSFLYKSGVWMRNKLFDKKIFRSAAFNFPVICVGNLAVGGTGKTPMVEYLVRLLGSRFKVATLSRGYKRKTRGFVLASGHTTAVDIGDEPMQIHEKFPEITVAVAEERVIGIPQLLFERPETEAIILDDAFQHREVMAGLNILLTDYHNLYTRDRLLPAGRLRDLPSSAVRAHIIIVTKCRPDMSVDEKAEIEKELRPLPHQKIYFTTISYDAPYHLFTRQSLWPDKSYAALLICGIADPKLLVSRIKEMTGLCETLTYGDHHIFTSSDLKEIKKKFLSLQGDKKMIITTEKDGVRLAKFEKEFADMPIFVMPVRHSFLFGAGEAFDKEVLDFVVSVKKEGTEA